MTGRRVVCRSCGEVVPHCTYEVDECEDCYGDAGRRRRMGLVKDLDRRQLDRPGRSDSAYDGLRTSPHDA